ncbi:60S ribosomal protein L43 [Spiromyces aspiralis]|uniref:60S ribosomal protein L43 n=1 Tax=Spiromyces aspiralis TaxID=68401 RepID=A0ACC1HHE7_9FUNG|nr:60S ribosomal protein L43 [Spiromyces aspiralis]
MDAPPESSPVEDSKKPSSTVKELEEEERKQEQERLKREAEQERQRLEEEERKQEQERLKREAEQERQRLEEEERKQEQERLKREAEQERQRLEEEERKQEQERQRLEEEKRKQGPEKTDVQTSEKSGVVVVLHVVYILMFLLAWCLKLHKKHVNQDPEHGPDEQTNNNNDKLNGKCCGRLAGPDASIKLILMMLKSKQGGNDSTQDLDETEDASGTKPKSKSKLLSCLGSMFRRWRAKRKEKKERKAKRTRKVGVTGKYGTRYGSSLRKQVKKMEITQHAKYTCTFCGKDAVRRTAIGIWKCKACNKTTAGGAWTLSTTAAATARSTVRRLRELLEQ